MFCPFCDRQIKDNSLFCKYCGKALPQKSLPFPVTQQMPQINAQPQTSSPRKRLSNNAKKGIVTGILIAGLIIVVLLIYYPSIFPWNW
jgi:uncharacterized membrane protein YvbJ